jgi:hypothetical protein
MVRMRALLSFLMLLGAVSALLLGATAGTAAADAAPCHEAAAAGHPEAPASETPDDAQMAMTCCIACVGAPLLSPPSRPRVAEPTAPSALFTPRFPPGLSPAPEPGPPR